MGNYWVEEADGNLFVIHRSDIISLVLGWKEMEAIEKFIRKRGWKARIESQIDKDEDSLDFGEISRDEFVSLCLDDIGDRAMVYGEDYEPDFEAVVFDVAEMNDMWRD